MYPQKTFGGYVETEVLQDGRIKYYIHMLGFDEPNEVIFDPADEEQARGIRQLHLIMREEKPGEEEKPNYVIEGEDIDGILATIEKYFKKVDGK